MGQYVTQWPFQVNYCKEITRIMWPILFRKIAKQKISHIQSIPSEFPWHDIISGNLLELRFYSTPSFSMSLSQSFISHLISLVLGACTSLGNHLGERQVFIRNILVHWANEVSEKIGAFILHNALSRFTMFTLGKSNWRGSLAHEWDSMSLLTSNVVENIYIPKEPYPALYVASKRVCHIHHGELFNYRKENDRKTEHLRWYSDGWNYTQSLG